MKRPTPRFFRIALCLGTALVGYGPVDSIAKPHQTAAPQLPIPSAVIAQTNQPINGATGKSGEKTAAEQTSPSPFHITGVVVDAATKSPIPNATLTAAPMTTVKSNRRSRRRFQNAADSATTDSEGRFDLIVPAAGGWELTAAARKFGTHQLDEHSGYSTAVVLTEASPRYDVEFRMTPSSVLEGFVLDEAGEPVRGANVALVYLPPPTPDDQHRRPQNRGQEMTDDRGFYKFATIAPGMYQVRVTAHPWYATSASGLSTLGGSAFRDGPPLNPGPDPLDVVYPTVWYPGSTDPSTATPITLRGGDTQEANFRLLPVPGSHLHISGPGDVSNDDREPRPGFPNIYLSRVLPDGTEEIQMTPTRMDGNGNADVVGLSPGSYIVHRQSPASNFLSLSTLQIGAGAARAVDLSEAVPAATVTVQVDPVADQDALQVSFRDLETGNTLFAQRIQDFGRPSPRRRGRIAGNALAQNSLQSPGQTSGPTTEDASPQASPATLPDRTVSLPPGKYEVFLNGVGDLHLAGIDAVGATASGRTVTIGTSAVKLFLHTSAGHGTVTGTVNLQGRPDPGAMVLLVPATLGDPSGIDLPSRDQSNTDGSFEMTNLLPGGYILVAIDHGWDVNWSDPATLRRFLVHGVPLDIKANSDLKQTIEAQSP